MERGRGRLMNRRQWAMVFLIMIVLVFVYWCMTIDVYASEPTPDPTEEPTPELTPTPSPTLSPSPSVSPSTEPSTAPDDDPEPVEASDYTAVLEEIRDTQYYMLYAMVAILAILLITIFVTGIDRR